MATDDLFLSKLCIAHLLVYRDLLKQALKASEARIEMAEERLKGPLKSYEAIDARQDLAIHGHQKRLKAERIAYVESVILRKQESEANHA